MYRQITILVAAAAFFAGCAEDLVPSPIEEPSDPFQLEQSGLVRGDLQYRENVTNFVFEGAEADLVEVYEDGTLIVTGSAREKLAEAKEADLVWLPDNVFSIDAVEMGDVAATVETRRFDLFDYVWGDFEIDLGEAVTRALLQRQGLWSPEYGYLTPEEAIHGVPEFGPDGYRRTYQAVTAQTNLGSITTSSEVSHGGFAMKTTGSVDFPVRVEGILKLRAYKRDAFLRFDASVDIDSEAANGEYPRCYNGRTQQTCVDHVLMKFEPGIKASTGIEISSNTEQYGKWELEGSDHRIHTIPVPTIRLGPYLAIKPSFIVDPIASVVAGNTITLAGQISGDLRIPLGVEYFGHAGYARRECGGCLGADCGCVQGANMLPNQRHEITKNVDAEASVNATVGAIEGTVGLKFALNLGIAPSVGLVVIDGIQAGVKLVGKAKYNPIQTGNTSEPCLTLAAKAIPFAGFDAKVRWDVGKKGELFEIASYEFNINELPLAKYEDRTYCVDLTPRNQVKLVVTDADIPSGQNDDPGYEVDAVWVTRPSDNNRVINSSNGTSTQYPPDGTCDASGNWTNVAVLNDGFTWQFPENLKPGDLVRISRLGVNGTGASCKPSGSAELFVTGGGADRSIGTADNSQSIFSFTLQQSDFL